MTTPSNRLYYGELDGQAIEALRAISAELCQEAAYMEKNLLGEPADQTDLDTANAWCIEAAKIDTLRQQLQAEYQKLENQFADQVETEKLAGGWSTAIAQSLRNGDWSQCAI